MINPFYKYGRLTPICFIEKYKHGGNIWLFKCDCDNEKKILDKSVLRGLTRSCGCIQKDICKKSIIKAIEINTKYNMSRTKFYQIWADMKQRCYNNLNKNFKHYGGRGIETCVEWLEFKNFYKDMYESYLDHIKNFNKRNTTLDRINNNFGYNKDNCGWATWIEQSLNKRTSRVFIAISPEGVEYTSNNQKQFGKDNNLIPSNINFCLKNKYKQHKGWTFKYLD